MNKLVRELAEQATEEIANPFDPWQYDKFFNQEKFAELIIHECAIAMSKIPGGYSAEKYYESNKIIKQHFGVE